jgi:hypothetical protein
LFVQPLLKQIIVAEAGSVAVEAVFVSVAVKASGISVAIEIAVPLFKAQVNRRLVRWERQQDARAEQGGKNDAFRGYRHCSCSSNYGNAIRGCR